MIVTSEHKIMKLDEEKRDRIINASMTEFNKGYDKASTDIIVREAGISKGLLFHYFTSKEKLHDFIVAYSIEVIVKEFFDLIDFGQKDFLKRIWQMILLKLDLSYKYPVMFDFVTTVYSEQKSDSLKEIKLDIFNKIAPKVFLDIDETLFREDIDVKTAVNIIYWAYVGYSTSQLERIGSPDISKYQKEYSVFLEEIEKTFAVFRKTFYKQSDMGIPELIPRPIYKEEV